MNRSKKKKSFRCFFITWIAISCSGIWGGCESADHAVILGTEQEENMEQTISTGEQGAFESSIEGIVQGSVDRLEQTGEDVDKIDSKIVVHVCGQVKTPGVYELPYESRKNAAIEAAGGFTEEADVTYINLAQTVTDGEQIYVPGVDEEKEDLRERNKTAESGKSGKVNLNTADEDALCTLPGIGATRARQIITYRESNGGFRSIQDIKNVSGIKESVFDKISELVTVE